jgi:hypothetical protein
MTDWKDPSAMTGLAFLRGIQVSVSRLLPFEAKDEQGELETIHAMSVLGPFGQPMLIVSQDAYDALAAKATIQVPPPAPPPRQTQMPEDRVQRTESS